MPKQSLLRALGLSRYQETLISDLLFALRAFRERLQKSRDG